MEPMLLKKVEGFLRQKELPYTIFPDGTIGVRYGSATAKIVCSDWNDRTLVRILAGVSMEIVQVTPELTRFLCEENNKLLFGKFSLDMEAKAVWYEHALLGDDLDIDELISAVVAIVSTADKYDEFVCNMTGGKRIADL